MTNRSSFETGKTSRIRSEISRRTMTSRSTSGVLRTVSRAEAISVRIVPTAARASSI